MAVRARPVQHVRAQRPQPVAPLAAAQSAVRRHLVAKPRRERLAELRRAPANNSTSAACSAISAMPHRGLVGGAAQWRCTAAVSRRAGSTLASTDRHAVERTANSEGRCLVVAVNRRTLSGAAFFGDSPSQSPDTRRLPHRHAGHGENRYPDETDSVLQVRRTRCVDVGHQHERGHEVHTALCLALLCGCHCCSWRVISQTESSAAMDASLSWDPDGAAPGAYAWLVSAWDIIIYRAG